MSQKPKFVLFFFWKASLGLPTREKEILDLVWSSNPDLVSSIQVDTFKDITDHSVVTATTSFQLGPEVNKPGAYLLESGRSFHLLDFSQAPWPEIQRRLKQVNWSTMESIVKEDVTAGHQVFISTILPILEELVPPKFIGKKFGKNRRHKTRRCLWRKLTRIKQKFQRTSYPEHLHS